MGLDRGTGIAARLIAAVGTVALGLRFGARTNRLGVSVPDFAEDPSGRGSPGTPASGRARRQGHETEDMSGGLMVRLGLGLGTAAMVMIFAMIGLRTWVRSHTVSSRPAFTALQVLPQPPPAPNMQANPIEEINAVRARAEALLHGYGFIDASHQHARIPIERAMTLVVGTDMGPPP